MRIFQSIGEEGDEDSNVNGEESSLQETIMFCRNHG